MLTDTGNPLGDSIFIGWHGRLDANWDYPRYDLFARKYWELLAWGTRLNHVIDDMEMRDVPGWTEIKGNFRYYGVVDLQYARFRYEGIN
jgi:hypothetical protein